MRNSFFDDLYQEEESDRLKQSFDIASRQNPDDVAEVGVLSRTTGIPPDIVGRNKEQVKAKERLSAIGIDDLRENYPGLATYLSNPRNAAISYDDVETLKGLYDTMNDVGPGNIDLLKKSWYDAMARFDTMSALGALEQAETAPQFADIHSQDYPDEAKAGLERLRRRRMQELGQGFSESVASAAQNLESSQEIGYSETVKQFLDGEGSLWDEFKANPLTIMKELSLGNAANLAFSAGAMTVGGLTAGAPGVAAGAGLSGLGIEYSASIMEGLQNAGFDPGDEQSMRQAFMDQDLMAEIRQRAVTRAAVIGTVEMIGGKLATKIVAPAALAAKPVSRETVNLVAQTGAQTALEGTGEALAGIAAGDGFQPVEVAAEMAGSMISAPIDVTVAAATGARDTWELNRIENERRVATVIREVNQQGRVDQIISLAQSSKTGSRDPAALANAVQSFGVQDETFYIDAAAARQALQNEDITGMPTVRTQLAESIATGTDIHLTADQFVNEVATSQSVELLRPHVRIGEEGMSMAELEANQTGMVEGLVQQAENAAEQKIEADRIYEGVRQQLVDSGAMSDRTAKLQAQIIPAYVATKASEYGISVEEAYSTYGLDIRGPASPAVQGDDGVTLEQAQSEGYEGQDTGEAAEWVAAKAKGLDMSQEARMQRARDMGFDEKTYYHGTPDNREIWKEGFKDRFESLRSPDSPKVPFFFSSDKNLAASYADDRRAFDYQGAIPETIPVRLKIQNPKKLQWGGGTFRESGINGRSLEDEINDARDAGHDAVVVWGIRDNYNADGRPSNVTVVFEPSQIRSINAAFDPDMVDSGNLLAQSAPVDQVDTPEFKAWAGEGAEVVESHDINDTDFSSGGPWVLRVFHGTTHDFNVFEGGERGNKGGHFGAVNYFTSDQYDAEQNYLSGGPDLTNRIEERKERLEYELENEYSELDNEEIAEALNLESDQIPMDGDEVSWTFLAQLVAEQELQGGNDQVMELFVRTENPFIVNGERKYAEFQDYEAASQQAVEEIADENGVSEEEAREEYENEIDDRTYEIMGEQSNDLMEAIQDVASEYEFDPQSIFEAVHVIAFDGGDHSSIESALRDSAYNTFIEDPENGDPISSHVVAEVIKRLGYDSIILKDIQDVFPNMGVGTTAHVHVFDENNTNIKSATDNRGTFDPNDPNILRQGEAAPDGQRRASIELFPDNAVIRLSEASDLSSFLHESGHYFMQMEKRFAEKYGVSDNQKALLKWLGAESFDEINPTTERGIELEEKFARGFEAYLREGKAPSMALKDAFAAFKRWLTRVYRTLTQLDVDLNDEIRSVFDRLLATEAEIQMARDNPAHDQLFGDSDTAGMSENEWDRYQGSVKRARNASQEDIDQKVIKEYRRQFESAWRQERDTLADQYEQDIKDGPVYQIVADSSRDKMDYESVIAIHGRVPNLLIGKAKKGGVDPQEYAEAYGYPSTSAMLRDIDESKGLKTQAREMADAEMHKRHGDILNDGTIEEEARNAIHNDEQAKVLLMELRALGRKAGSRESMIERNQLRARAVEHVANKKADQLRPNEYYRAEIKAATAAAQAVAAGDFKVAEHQKRLQLTNHYLFREATRAKQNVDKWRKHAEGVRKRKYSDSAVRPDYTRAMKMLVEMYDTRSAPDRQRMLSDLLAFYSGQMLSLNTGEENETLADIGQQLDLLDPFLIEAIAKYQSGQIGNVSVPTWQDLKVYELEGVYDTLRHMRFIGGQLSDIETAKRKADGDKLAASIVDNGGRDAKTTDEGQTGGDRAADQVRGYFGGLTNLRNLVRKLDGFEENGVARQVIWNRVEPMVNRYNDLSREMYETINREIPDLMRVGIGKSNKVEMIKHDGTTWELSDEGRFMLALYWGTESSRDAIRAGHGVTDSDVMAMLQKMPQEHLELVNAVWRVNESKSKEFFRVAHQMLGVAPEKIPAAPFTVNGVELTGGHMRLIYDDIRIEVQVEQQRMGAAGKMLQTRAASTFNRQGSGGRKVLLDKSSIFRSIDENIQYMAYAEGAREISRILKQQAVKEAIVRKHGKQFYRTLTENISGIVGHREITEPQGLARFAAKMSRWFRAAATAKHLIFSIRNVVQQISALPVAASEVGSMAMTKHVLQFGQNPAEIRRTVREKSAFMRSRTELINRETTEFIKQAIPDGRMGGYWQSLKSVGFTPQTWMDSVIAFPTWMARYEQGMAQHGNEGRAIQDADLAVSESVGSGSDLHLGSAFQLNNNEWTKVLTVFGTWFNTYYNRVYRATRGGQKMISLEAAQAILFMPMVVGVASAILVQNLPDDDDESWGEYIGWQWFLFLAGAFPIFREVGSAAEGFTPSSPLGDAAEAGWKAFDAARKLGTGDKDPVDASIAIAKGVSQLVPIYGSGEAIRIVEGALDDKQDFYGMLVEGKERDD